MGEVEPLFDREMKCLLCEQSSKTKKIRSRYIKVAEYDTDFCPKYAENSINGLFYNIFVCPHCGYASSNDFSKYFAPGTKEALFEKVTSKWKTQSYGGKRSIDEAIITYKLASYCGMLKKEKHITLAGIYLRIAWLYRLKEDAAQEVRFLKLARQEYAESYSKGDFQGTQVSEIRILYLCGELSRRSGQIEDAIKYFSKVIEKQKTAIETSIIQMARDRWAEIKEAKQKQQ